MHQIEERCCSSLIWWNLIWTRNLINFDLWACYSC
jgi:hypothetical protein